MDSILNIFKGIVAIGIVALLIFFGLTVFAFLLGIACVAALVFWLKRKLSPAAAPINRDYAEELHTTTYTSTTIIEGEAEDVTEKK